MKYTDEEVKKILKDHADWENDKNTGKYADLTGADLTRANLTRANLTGADLTCANLTRANLTDADLTGANLTGADLTGAYLSRANLTRADLTGANLSRADLTGANLTDSNLTRAYLTGADLTGAYLTDADLTGADLSRAYLSRANLTRAYLTRANLTRADLTGADLTGVYGTVKVMGATQGNFYWKRFNAGLINYKYKFKLGLNKLVKNEIFAEDERILCSYPGFHFASRSWCAANYPERPYEALIQIPADAKINEPWATDGKASADSIIIIQIFDTKTGEDVTEKFR